MRKLTIDYNAMSNKKLNDLVADCVGLRIEQRACGVSTIDVYVAPTGEELDYVEAFIPTHYSSTECEKWLYPLLRNKNLYIEEIYPPIYKFADFATIQISYGQYRYANGVIEVFKDANRQRVIACLEALDTVERLHGDDKEIVSG